MTKTAYSKHPGVAFWATVVVVVGFVYVMSVGPASRLSHDSICPDWVNRKLPTIYRPVLWLLENVPEPISDVAFDYIHLWRQKP